MKVLNFGSLNVDHVYAVAHIVRPGETLGSDSYTRFPGGKGANQSVALARAGAEVWHAGMVGPESEWLRGRLAEDGVNVDLVRVDDGPGGHAIIQVEESGQNSIVLFGGANQRISAAHRSVALAACDPGDVLLLQNEINGTSGLIRQAHGAGLRVCLNPAPMDESVHSYPLELLDLLIVNEHEGEALAGETVPERILDGLAAKYPQTRLCLTLGGDGIMFREVGGPTVSQQASAHRPVDTTAAGDTFIGFFLAAEMAGKTVAEALAIASEAAGISVTRPGAMDSIPWAREV
ncbi:MAG: ribokinase [Victivallales bacterium]|nr:ribokinase [Victivallales bacterium]